MPSLKENIFKLALKVAWGMTDSDPDDAGLDVLKLFPLETVVKLACAYTRNPRTRKTADEALALYARGDLRIPPPNKLPPSEILSQGEFWIAPMEMSLTIKQYLRKSATKPSVQEDSPFMGATLLDDAIYEDAVNVLGFYQTPTTPIYYAAFLICNQSARLIGSPGDITVPADVVYKMDNLMVRYGVDILYKNVYRILPMDVTGEMLHCFAADGDLPNPPTFLSVIGESLGKGFYQWTYPRSMRKDIISATSHY